MVKLPGAERTYSFVLLMKGYDQRMRQPEFKTDSGIESLTKAQQSCLIEIAGKRLEVCSTFEYDPTGTKQTLTVNGKQIDLKLGRVLLADFSGKELVIKQVIAEFPANPAVAQETIDVEKSCAEIGRRVQEKCRRGA